jgi:hypothetical protein
VEKYPIFQILKPKLKQYNYFKNFQERNNIKDGPILIDKIGRAIS